MKEILGDVKTIRMLLSNAKYSIDYYQREYRWEAKQIEELISDLTGKFMESYEEAHERQEVEGYGHYFLGSIIISQREGKSFIIDGQQRLTSLTLLLVYLNNLQKARKVDNDLVPLDELIYSRRFAHLSFNLDVEERQGCMETLFKGGDFDPTDQPESVQNIVARHADIEAAYPEELRDRALPFFIDWLIEKVYLVEIVATTDEDAYTIFETMNDRGLQLTPTDMLKGYLLANIKDSDKRAAMNTLWKKSVQELAAGWKDAPANCITAWLRSQYAEKIRERKRNAAPEDYDLIGTEFHRWVRNHEETLGLHGSADFIRFIERDFRFYQRQYLRIARAVSKMTPGLEPVYYTGRFGFTLQYPLLLAPLTTADSEDTVVLKMRLVATYLESLIVRRVWNYRSISHSTMQYAMFLLMREIRHKSPAELASILHKRMELDASENTFYDWFYLHGQNRPNIHLLLARLTDYVERESGLPSHYSDYIVMSGKHAFEVEHIWADKFEQHTDEFTHPHDFQGYRNRFGGLLLLPKSFNASFGALPYINKLPNYFGQNLLARSLHQQCYANNPGFLAFMSRSALPFVSHEAFAKEDNEARCRLYAQLAERIWNPAQLDKMVAEAGQ